MTDPRREGSRREEAQPASPLVRKVAGPPAPQVSQAVRLVSHAARLVSQAVISSYYRRLVS